MRSRENSLEVWDELLEMLVATTEGIYSLLQFIIRKIYRDFGVDRIAFFVPENGKWILKLKFDDRDSLPGFGEMYPLEEEVDLSDDTDDPLIITPRSGIGFDMFIVIRSRDQILGIMGLDDTSSRREFSEMEIKVFRSLVGVINSLISRHDYFSDLIYIDSLTTVYNRRYFDENFTRLISPGCTVAMIDVDKFKRINDTHGHPMGDAVLSELGRFLQSSLRKKDIVFRYGGEEFVVLFLDCSLQAAYQRLNSILYRFKEKNITNDGSSITGVTFSAGVCYHLEGASRQIISEADSKLYAAKENGRSRIEM